MSVDLQRILDGKRALRRDLASRPVAEKLAMLEMLRERTRAIRGARPHGTVRSRDPAQEPSARRS
jgi:hypothetical protein